MNWFQAKFSLDNDRLWFGLLLVVIVLSFLLSSSLLERLAVIIELICIWLLAKEKVWTFPVGIVSTLLFFFIFLEAHLYGSMLLQGYFLAMNIFGWVLWTKASATTATLRTRSLSKKGWVACITVLTVLPLLFSYILQTFTNAQTTYLDSVITVLCMIASVLTAYKILENWYAWIVCEALYLFLYIEHELYLAVAMSLVISLLNTQGLLRWKRKMEAAQKAAHLSPKRVNKSPSSPLPY